MDPSDRMDVHIRAHFERAALIDITKNGWRRRRSQFCSLSRRYEGVDPSRHRDIRTRSNLGQRTAVLSCVRRAGDETLAESRIPRVPGGGTHRAGQGTFGNMCRGGRMFAPNEVWRCWHGVVNVNQKRSAVALANAASAVTSFVLARGHEDVPELPLVVSDSIECVEMTDAAVKILKQTGAFHDAEKAKDSHDIHPGKGKMRSTINFTLYGRLIQRCTDRGLLRQAKQLQARLILSSAIADNFLASKLIAFYSKTNNLSRASRVYDLIPSKNTFAFNALLIAYCVHNHHAGTLTQFFSLLSCKNVCRDLAHVEPDAFTMSCVLKAMSEVVADEPVLPRMIHCYVMKKGFCSDSFVGNGLMTYYSRSDDLVSARGLFDEMPEKDLVSWNAMIAGYSQGGFYKECKDLYNVMLDSEELKPDAITVISTLHACAQSNDLIFGMEVHQYVIDNRIEMDVSVCNAVIAVYAKCGSLDYAKELFEEMSEKDEISYSTIISGYMVHGLVDEAMTIFMKMRNPALSTWNAAISGQVQNNKYDQVIDLVRQMQVHGRKPNCVTLSSLLPAIPCVSHLKGGKEIHAYAIKISCDENIYVVTALIDTYAKLGFLCGAQRVFDLSKIRSVIVWTSIISAYATHGDANFALSLFDKMLMGKTKPDEVTITAVLAACAHGGLLDKAQDIFDSLLPNYGIHPLVNHYACVVVCMSRAGRLSQALKFIEKMPIEPSAKVWGALFSGASEFGDVELGKFVYDHLIELEPDNPSNYIIMANLYSEAGRWEEAEKVRGTLKNLGLKKIAASSRV